MDYSPFVPDPGLIYVQCADRATFDRIDRPLADTTGRTNVLVKRVEEGGCVVIFQHWLADSSLVMP